jgi:hypothetical protein
MPKDAQDLWWGLYQENLSHARHHESQRTSVTAYFAAIGAGILGFIGLDKCVSEADWPLLAMLFVIGIVGALLTAKQYERYTHHMERARQYRDALEKSVEGSHLEELKKAGDAIAEESHPYLSEIRLVSFWIGLHLLNSTLAVVMFVSARSGLLACIPAV